MGLEKLQPLQCAEELKNIKFNIIITGTPGVGKTKLSSHLANLLGKYHVDVSAVSISKKMTLGYDSKLESHFIDEDMINEHIEQLLKNPPENLNGLIIDYHGVDFYDYPENIAAIIVVTADTAVLKRRYIDRGYNSEKIKNNIDCELFRILFEEAYNYIEDKSKIFEFKSSNESDYNSSLDRLITYLYDLLDS